MRVNDLNLTGTSAAQSGAAQQSKAISRGNNSSAGTSHSNANGDRVELSDTLTSLSNALSAYGANRAAKVQTLTTQYQSGTYQVSSGAISQSMIGEALGLGGN